MTDNNVIDIVCYGTVSSVEYVGKNEHSVLASIVSISHEYTTIVGTFIMLRILFTYFDKFGLHIYVYTYDTRPGDNDVMHTYTLYPSLFEPCCLMRNKCELISLLTDESYRWVIIQIILSVKTCEFKVVLDLMFSDILHVFVLLACSYILIQLCWRLHVYDWFYILN